MKSPSKCPVCEVEMTKTGEHGVTEHHLFFPKKEYVNNTKLPICRSCHQEFNDSIKHYSKIKKRDCLVLFVRFCKGKGKNAYAIYQQLKGVSVV